MTQIAVMLDDYSYKKKYRHSMQWKSLLPTIHTRLEGLLKSPRNIKKKQENPPPQKKQIQRNPKKS